ncbi:MAG: hypothetical protein ABJA32_00035 [Ginsengibacter sp.]
MQQVLYANVNKVDKKIYFFYVLVFCLSAINFFSPVVINSSILLYLYYGLFLTTTVIIIFNYRNSYHNSFSLPVSLILFAGFLAALNSSYSWEESLYDSFRGVLPFSSYILFFLLSAFRFEKKDTEKLILILGIFFIIVFLFTFAIYPRVLFGDINQNDETRGFQRIRTDGIGYLFLLSFFSLSEYILKKKALMLFIYFGTLTCIIMSLTRTYIIFSILFSLFFILKKSNIFTILCVIAIVAGGFYVITKTNFYKLMAEETTSQTSDLKNDIRMKSVEYYLNYFSPNSVSKFLGNGQANGNNSYSRFVSILEQEHGLYISDIGYIGLYIKFGILAILAYLLFIYKTLRKKANEQTLYCKYFLLFIFTINIIIDSSFNNSFIGSIMISYYILSFQKSVDDENTGLPEITIATETWKR